MINISELPALNASLNGLAAVFLLAGWHAIKQGNKILHKKFMVSAFICSMFFFIFYLTYHILVPGVTRFEKTGIVRIIYFIILGTHTPLAMVIPPASLAAVYYAYKKKFDKHTKITRWLLPIWIYVSVTGVVIYIMLYTLKGRGF